MVTVKRLQFFAKARTCGMLSLENPTDVVSTLSFPCISKQMMLIPKVATEGVASFVGVSSSKRIFS